MKAREEGECTRETPLMKMIKQTVERLNKRKSRVVNQETFLIQGTPQKNQEILDLLFDEKKIN